MPAAKCSGGNVHASGCLSRITGDVPSSLDLFFMGLGHVGELLLFAVEGICSNLFFELNVAVVLPMLCDVIG